MSREAADIVAATLRETLTPLVDPFGDGNADGWLLPWCDAAATAVVAALGGLTRQWTYEGEDEDGQWVADEIFTECPTENPEGNYRGGHRVGRWVSGWMPNEALSAPLPSPGGTHTNPALPIVSGGSGVAETTQGEPNMTSAEQRDRDLLDRVTNVLEGVSPPPWSFYMDDEWDAAVFVDRTPDAHEPTQNDTYLFLCPDCGTRGGATVHDAQFVAAARQLVPELAAELSRLRAQETRIRALCVESENEKWMREISRDATGRPICQHTVLAADILAVLDTEEGQA